MEILVADDSPVNLKMYRHILLKLGHKVDCATNGREVLEALEKKKYQVLFLDCQMPIIDGFEAARTISQRWKSSHRPYIVALTANSLNEIKKHSDGRYFDSYLPKSFGIDELKKVLKQAWEEVNMKKSPTNAQTGDAPEHAVMNQVEFFQNFNGVEELISPTIEQFFLQYPVLMDKIHADIVAKNPKELEINAHTLKGSLAIFRAHHCVSLAKKLEYMGKDNSFENALDCYKKLAREGERLLALLKTLKEQAAA